MKTSSPSLSFRSPFGSPSFALISVLALVSLAALTATAFLASARLERTATRPLGEKVRLEMALNIGFNCAKEIINSSMGSSYDTVATYWRTNPADDVGYLLSGYPRNLVGSTATPQMYWFAAFSTAKMTELATNAPPTAVITTRVTVDNQSMFSNTISTFMAGLTNFGANGSTNIELIGHTSAKPRLSPPVGWMTIKQPVRTTPGKTNTTPTPVMRIAFFTEDLSGLIDAERMCGSTSRDTGTNPTEISMANIGPTPGITFGTATNTRATYLTPSLLASNGPIATTNLRYFATGLRSWTNAVQRIPRAIAIAPSKCYGGAIVTNGAKFVIPTNPTASDVAKIAAALTTNLPDFGARSGAMNATAYISNIAANIVDYVDTDGSPTIVGTYSTPNYSQGVDSYPWVNEVATRVTVQSYTVSSGNLVLNMRGFAELWNLSDKTFTGPITLTMNENDSIQAESATATTAPNTPLQTSGTLTTNITILPMQFKVVEVFSNLVTLTVPEPSGTGTKYVTWPTASTNSTFELKISGVTVQKPLGGLARRVDTSKTLTGNSDCLDLTTPALMETGANSRKIYRGNPLTHTNLASFDFMNEGDPRMTPFRIIGTSTSHTWATYEPGASYFMGNGRSSFGGWNTNSNLSQLSLTNLLEPSYPLTPGNMPTGPVNANGIFAVLPTSVVPIAPEPTKALQKLNNTGTFSNIFELGNIFDPVQWSFSSAIQPGQSIPSTAVATGSAQRRGGGNTLRIGRPEHSRFAFTNLGGATGLPIPNMGQSAAALLDVFCTTNAIDDGGKININTASGPVLAALAGGISLKSDLAKVGAEVNTTMVAAFTNGVMKFRQTYPFYSTSQLPFISTNYGSANWTNTWNASAVFSTNTGCGLNGITELNDQGMEEWFSKIYGLSTVQSRNFRIYVYAQMVNSNNVPYGRIMRKYYHLYTEQTAEGPNDVFNDAGFSMVPERESEY